MSHASTCGLERWPDAEEATAKSSSLVTPSAFLSATARSLTCGREQTFPLAGTLLVLQQTRRVKGCIVGLEMGRSAVIMMGC